MLIHTWQSSQKPRPSQLSIGLYWHQSMHAHVLFVSKSIPNTNDTIFSVATAGVCMQPGRMMVPTHECNQDVASWRHGFPPTNQPNHLPRSKLLGLSNRKIKSQMPV